VTKWKSLREEGERVCVCKGGGTDHTMPEPVPVPRLFLRAVPMRVAMSVTIVVAKSETYFTVSGLAWWGSSIRHGSTQNKVAVHRGATKKRNPEEKKRLTLALFSFNCVTRNLFLGVRRCGLVTMRLPVAQHVCREKLLLRGLSGWWAVANNPY
jgi:hypothetical protein